MIKSYKDEIKEKSIDLHRYYPDKYKKNTYYNVPKEVADLLEKERKAENRSISQYKYYIKFTLDLNDYISRTYLLTNNTPETILNKLEEIEEQKINEDIQKKNVEIIYYILDDLNPIAKKRFLEYALEGKKIVEIAKEENVNHGRQKSDQNQEKFEGNLDRNDGRDLIWADFYYRIVQAGRNQQNYFLRTLQW